MSVLYIVPSLLASDGGHHIPEIVIQRVNNLRLFVVERTRTARRFIRSIIPDFPIDDASFFEMDKHDDLATQSMINELFDGTQDIGLLSEAGTPCIADPGAMVVHLARKRGYEVTPLSGPSSLILALMSSGMNGQQFSFHGYLPIKEPAIGHKLAQISTLALKGATQLFIETPYRNDKLLKAIQKNVDQSLMVSISLDLTSVNEKHIYAKVSEIHQLQLGKSPAIFCIGKLQ